MAPSKKATWKKGKVENLQGKCFNNIFGIFKISVLKVVNKLKEKFTMIYGKHNF